MTKEERFNNKIPKDVLFLFYSFEKAGYQLFLVGGCVRDFLIGRPIHDWDMCTNAKPEQIIELIDKLAETQDTLERIYRPIYSLYADEFKKIEFKTIATGLKHGTVTVVVNGTPYEITTYRRDGNYSDGRHPDNVAFIGNLIEDLKRRDFTVNAIAYNPSVGFVDPFNGRKDIRSGYIRCVGNPVERFHEDGLRILRAIRFAAQLNFDVTAPTAVAIHQHKQLLSDVSAERIQSEFCKILNSRNGGYEALKEFSDVICHFIPEVKPMIGFEQNNPWHDFDIWEHTLQCLKPIIGGEPDIIVRLAIFFHDIGKPDCYLLDLSGVGHFYGHAKVSAQIAEIVLKRLKFSNEVVNDVVQLIENHDAQFVATPAAIKRMLNKLGEKQLYKLIALRMHDIIGQKAKADIERGNNVLRYKEIVTDVIAEESCFKLKDLDIDGDDLIRIGIPKGPTIGHVLEYLLNVVIDGEIENNNTKLIELVKKEYLND